MGDKKKHKDKEKDKKKDKKKDKEEKKKNKKDKYSSASDSDDSDDSNSDSSKSVSRSRKKDKQKKIKKDKKQKKDKESPHRETPASSNVPYNFDNVVSTTFPATIPGIKGMPIPAIPPPASNVASTASVPKPKSKEPNIFKLLPKLNYGPVLFAKTIYSGEYLGQNCQDKLFIEMTHNIEQTIKEQQHKKGMTNITKCIAELDKVFAQQKEERAKTINKSEDQIPKQKNNRYELLQKVYHDQIVKITASHDSS